MELSRAINCNPIEDLGTNFLYLELEVLEEQLKQAYNLSRY